MLIKEKKAQKYGHLIPRRGSTKQETALHFLKTEEPARVAGEEGGPADFWGTGMGGTERRRAAAASDGIKDTAGRLGPHTV